MIEITLTTPKGQITLNQEEIHTAVEDYVRKQITVAENQQIDIDFTAGRGANGLSATLDIRPIVLNQKAVPAIGEISNQTEPVDAIAGGKITLDAGVNETTEPETEIETETADAAEEEAPAKPSGSIFSKGDSPDEGDASDEKRTVDAAPAGRSIFSKAS